MRFPVRDLFLVTVIVAVVLGWWTERSRIQRENWRLTRENAALRKVFHDEHNHRLQASSDAEIHRAIHAELLHEKYLLKKNALPNSGPNLSKP